MAKIDLQNIVERIVDLPTLPQVVTTIMSLIEDPNSSAKDINDVMSHDPALVGKILKLVNSAFYGLPNRVSSIQQAITILGFNTVKSLAISASVFDLFGGGDENFSYEDFWTHSIGTASVCRFMTGRNKTLNPDTAFVLGLLHGMGKLVLDQYAPVEFQEILEIASEKELTFPKAEREVIDTGYAQIGYWLANKWQLEECLQQVVKFQNNLAECPEEYQAYAAILRFSSYICRVRNYGANGDFGKPALSKNAWEWLGVEKDALPALIAEVDEELEKARDFVNIVHS